MSANFADEGVLIDTQGHPMRSVLITGATGFVGSALGVELVKKGVHVRGCIHNRNNRSLLPQGVEGYYIRDINDLSGLDVALDGVDTVFHLAARVHIFSDEATDPLAAFRTVNVAGTKHLAYAAAKKGVKRLVFLSTIGVNGNTTDGKGFTERDEPRPHNLYSISKWEAERILLSIASQTGMEIVVVRSPLVYGPGNPGNMLRLLKVICSGVPLPFASVANVRSLIFIGNLIDSLATCAIHPRAAGKTFLVSDGEDVSISNLIRKLAFALDRPARLVPVSPALMRFAAKLFGKSALVEQLLNSLIVDGSKIRSELSWLPSYSMSEGIRETAEWYKALFLTSPRKDITREILF